ncbi:GerAB/ArcD/ProY family transporter [Brevibacillus formosus]|nr:MULTISPECIES: GerAB/ArcD/ProY family transporter [Brevibacillus]KLH97731.1 spore gernimation protein [Brevibacillus formosus]MED1946728.1 GerAB/ArcD/ProY family transporter [Brevibacillus formosus]MED1957467.1 GerAB/ArcD/ProY family transporter [Brevibacillus formosus]MED1996986.1 GerAB/ArcD/ProY family transporter [Brevibacillus formosus]MED2084903.1 GerAB/ArcD/ProY family transporter [Brevibacillus formosus]
MSTISRHSHMFISVSLAMFIVHGNQVGIGIAGVQRFIYDRVQQDAWIAVIIAGLMTHVAAWVMLKILRKYKNLDLYDIHQMVFGKWPAKVLNLIFIIYIMGSALTILRGYIEIIQSWMFPEVPSWLLNASLLCLAIYGVTGGIRVLAGISFFSVGLTICQLLLMIYPAQYADFNLLQPVFHHDLVELLDGARKMSFSIIGFEIILFIYPFVKEKQLLSRYVHGGLLMTTLLYVVVMLVTLLYFQGEQLKHLIWATLMMMKIVEFPFLERFEFVSISLWMLIMLDNLLLNLWVAMRGVHHIGGFKERKALIGIVIVMFFASNFLETRQSINWITDVFGAVGFYIIFVYPLVLYIVILLFRKGTVQT